MSYHAKPPDTLPPERTGSDLRWAEGWRRYGTAADALQSDPVKMAAFRLHCKRLGEKADERD